MAPTKKPRGRKTSGRPAKELEQLRKTGWRCASCYEWHPTIEARNACKHTRVQGKGA